MLCVGGEVEGRGVEAVGEVRVPCLLPRACWGVESEHVFFFFFSGFGLAVPVERRGVLGVECFEGVLAGAPEPVVLDAVGLALVLHVAHGGAVVGVVEEGVDMAVVHPL